MTSAREGLVASDVDSERGRGLRSTMQKSYLPCFANSQKRSFFLCSSVPGQADVQQYNHKFYRFYKPTHAPVTAEGYSNKLNSRLSSDLVASPLDKAL